MASTAPEVLVFQRPGRALPDLFMPSADRRKVIRYPGGHVVKINREHLDRVLAAKAAKEDEIR